MSLKTFLALSGFSLSLISCQVSIPENFQLSDGRSYSSGANDGGGGGNFNDDGDGGSPTPNPTAPPEVREPQVVEFIIQPGTGSGPWNSSNNYLEVKVGDTIRIRNMDSTIHQLHMPGNSTCPHGSGAIPTGGFYDCKTTKPFETNRNNPQSYDHVVNSSVAPFFFRVTL